jgi:hypothetical protein
MNRSPLFVVSTLPGCGSPCSSCSAGPRSEIVGKALKGRRDDVVLATKLWMPMGDDPNQRGNSRRWIITEIENSLRRLQTDHIDLYQIHRPDPDTDIEETLSALSDLIHCGKVRAIGSSTMPASDIVEAQWVAERRGLERFRTEQPTYSILSRGPCRGHAGHRHHREPRKDGRPERGQHPDVEPGGLSRAQGLATGHPRPRSRRDDLPDGDNLLRRGPHNRSLRLNRRR